MTALDWVYIDMFPFELLQDSRGVTHTGSADKASVSVMWTAPPMGTGQVDVRFAVVRVQTMYWANQLAATLQGMCKHMVDTWWTLMQSGHYREHHLWYNVCKYIFVIQLSSLYQNARMQCNDNQLPNLQFDSVQWPCMILLTFACMFYILLWTSHM